MDNQFHTAAWFEEYADLKDDVISRSEWDDLKDFRNFLQPFYRATKRLEGDSSSLEKALATMDYLIAHYKELKLVYSDDPTVLEHIFISWYKFDKYYQLTDSTPSFVAAILLYPALRE